MRRAFVLCGLLATTAAVRADTSVRQPVVGFRVRGNSKLTDRTLGYVIHVELGELKGDDDIAEIDQALHTSELFETVKVTLEEAPGGVVIVADLEDKHSWIIAPTAFLLPGNRAFGVGYAENDLGGEDAKLLLYAQIGDHTSLGFGTYLDPAFRGTKLQFRVDLYPLHKQIVEYANADPRSQVVARETTFTFLDAGVLVGWVFQWWLIADVRFRGAYQYFRNSHLDDAALTPVKTPEKDGWDIGVQTRLTIDARHHHFGLTWGPYVQLQLEKSVPGLDSYGYGDFLLRAYYSWALFCDHELELRTHLSAGYHLPLNEDGSCRSAPSASGTPATSATPSSAPAATATTWTRRRTARTGGATTSAPACGSTSARSCCRCSASTSATASKATRPRSTSRSG